MSRIARLAVLASALAAPLGCSMCSDCADEGPTAVREHYGYRPSYDDNSGETTYTVDAEPIATKPGR